MHGSPRISEERYCQGSHQPRSRKGLHHASGIISSTSYFLPQAAKSGARVACATTNNNNVSSCILFSRPLL